MYRTGPGLGWFRLFDDLVFGEFNSLQLFLFQGFNSQGFNSQEKAHWHFNSERGISIGF
jgi:hypothetical protein